MNSQSISLCMIAKDEEHFLGHCLDSVKGIVDEIIIVLDHRSSDNTDRIAKNYGAKVIEFKWCDDFSAARNRSLELATKDWILVLDADEELSTEGIKKIKDLIEDPINIDEPIIGFKLNQMTYVLKDRTRYVPYRKRWKMNQYVDQKSVPLVRLFKNNPKIRFSHKVHERVEDSIEKNDGKIIYSGITLHHFASLKGMEFYIDKIKQYTEIMMQQLKDDPDNIRYLWQAGNTFFDNEEYDLALTYYTKVAKRDPQYKLIFSDIAKCHVKKGNHLEAVKSFNKSIAVKPDEPSAANNLAVLYMQVGRFETAQKLLAGYISKFPDNEALKHNLTRLKSKISIKD